MNAIGPRSLPVEDKRVLLLDCAERVFCREGYAGTTIAGIAGEAGVTRPTVYAYFPSKDDVFMALAARVREELLELQEQADVSSAGETIRSTLTAYLAAYTRHRGMLTVIEHQALSDPGIRQLHHEIHARSHRRHVRFIERLAEDGSAAPAASADLIADAITGVVMRYSDTASDSPARLPELTEALIDLYRAMVGVGGT